ncbi:MAG: hypothetical protein ABIH21_00645 [Patescibacteria group bacterium]
MKITIKPYFKMLKSSRLFVWLFVLSVIFLILTVLMPVWRIIPLSAHQQFIPLHYNVFFGIDQFGPWQYVFVIPVIGLIVFIINSTLQVKVLQKDIFLAQIIGVTTTVVEMIFFTAMFFIILLNI